MAISSNPAKTQFTTKLILSGKTPVFKPGMRAESSEKENTTGFSPWKFIFFLMLILELVIFAIPAKKQSQNINLESSPPLVLSKEEYQKIKTELLSIVENENPRVAIDKLKIETDKRKTVLNSCHELLHEIGIESFKKYQDFAKAVVYKDDICVSGYIHGVIEANFENAKDIPSTIKTTCKDYPPNKFITWECYHGVGHGLMYLNNNDVIIALEGCRTYQDDFSRSACSNGVYMENFNADSVLHPSQFLNPKDEFYPCNKLGQDKDDCYMNAPIYYLALHNYDYTSGFDWCNSAENLHLKMCFYGLASQMARRNMENPKFVEKYCLKLQNEARGSCIYGLVGWYISYYASLEEATKLCSELEAINKPECEKMIDTYRSQF